MQPTSRQIRQLQLLEFDAFKNFVLLCEKFGFTYFLLGGTLLGAVRHEGFIPWDDDIDIGMPRRDYDAFVSVAQENISPRFFIQTHISDPEYTMNYAKIRISNTTYIEKNVASKRINHGVFIDVFPLDVYPDNSKVFDLKKKLLDLRINSEFDSFFVSRKTRVVVFLCKLLYPSLRIAVKARERLFKSVKKGKRIANLSGAWGKKEIVPAEWYGKGTKLMFEGIEVVVPQHYDLWLSQVYGDYMTLPPEEKRKPHHYVVAIDTERSYKEYINR